MTTVKVLIDSIQKVKEFSSIIARWNVECELVDGPRILDAKSIMGIFSLNLSKPLELRIHSDNANLVESIRKFIV
ncbi:MAG: HPr domain-containing protein [Thermocaproicibacter melissae]|jgi:phosphocarrier protein HPr|uniref:HPr family phosphocarrier protein n=1 Tax=Thermocaproicibacter melissae TaxID=2966552 RepID=UPI0024B101D5|nr:HPr family phosphocarrier protein [Thermocaproicibacter melissae]WBY64935.1 HPr family phosphocarrier protein [Thermocaproicibacter melissae]